MWEKAAILFFVCSMVAGEDDNCSVSLGASYNGYLPNTAFTASSESNSYGAVEGRLSNRGVAWIPLNFQPAGQVRTEYLQVDLGQEKTITAVTTQGLTGGKLFVKSFMLRFGNEDYVFDLFFEAKSFKEFDGNIDSLNSVTQKLPCTVAARYVQFVPLNYVVGIALKVDVLGCDTVVAAERRINDFKVVNVTSSSISLTWFQMKPDVAFFHITYQPVGNIEMKPPQFQVRYQSNARKFQLISALTSCTKYKITLRVFNTKGCGVPEVHTIVVTTRNARPLPPQKLVADNSIPRTIMLRWKNTRVGYQCANLITGFVLFYREQVNPKFIQLNLDSNILAYNMTGLSSWQKYQIHMTTVSKQGQSDSVNLLVDVDGTPPEEPPVITTLVSNDPNSFFIAWKSPPKDKIGGTIIGYTISYRLKTDTETAWSHQSPANLKINTALITSSKELKSWKVYEVVVTLSNLKYKKKSDVKQVLVKGKAPFKAPENVTAVGVTKNSIALTWIAVPLIFIPNVFQGYQVFLLKQKTFVPIGNLSSGTKANLENLESGTEYSFAVAASSNNITGPYSSQLKVTTPLGKMPLPEIISLVSSHPNTITLKWNVSENMDTPSYILHYKESPNIDTWMDKFLGNVMETTIRNLKHWKQYDVKIELQSKGRSIESVVLPVMVIGKAPGKAPVNFQHVRVGYHNITLQWDPIDPKYIHGVFKGYTVKYGIDGDSNSYRLVNTTQRLVTVQHLKNNTFYQFQVAGITEGGIGVFTDFMVVKTKAIVTPATPVIRFLQNVLPTKITLEWSSIDVGVAGITKVIVRLTDLNSVEQPREENMNVEKIVTITVAPFTKYQIDIKTCIEDTCSPYSKPRFITSMEDKPSKVLNLHINKADNVVVKWAKPANIPGILRKYVIDIKNSDIDSTIQGYPKEVDNNTNTYILDGLPPYTNLLLEVKAFTTKPGPGAEIKFLSPEGLPGTPSKVLAVLLLDDTMSVKWDEPEFPNGVITNYKVEYRGIKVYNRNYKEKKTVELSSIKTMTRIGQLVPGTTYYVQVYAKTVKGYGSPSQPEKIVQTPPKAPTQPEIPDIYKSEVTSTTITVQLKPAEQEFGEVYSYQVIIETVSKRKRRATSKLPNNLYGYTKAVENNMSMYIAADLLADQVKFSAKFVVGDGRIYKGYENVPLKPETVYKLHVRATTKHPVKGFYYGPASTVDLPKTGKAKEDPTSLPIAMLCGVGGAILLIIIIVVVVAFYIRSSRRKKKDMMDPYELGILRVRSVSDSAPPERPVSLSDNHLIHPDHPPLPVAAFAKHVAKLHRNDNNGFKAEYNQLEIGKEFSWDVAHLPENKPKNRYANIVAYDHSRVILSKIEGLPGSDYINASYIDGFKKANNYVSTQGPLPSSFEDFWRMVWEQHSSCIVMLSNLQEKNKLKCHKYWPDDCTEYGDIIVTQLRKEPFADYTIRTFQLERVPKQKNFQHEIREVKQFHFTSWPDHGVPQYSTSILSFRKKVRFHLKPEAGPTVVHCSAGVGRSGAYIVIDIMLDRVQQQMDVDVFNTVATMRSRRIAMVQTEGQYIFVHDAVLEAILSGDTQILIHELKGAIRKLDQIESDSKVSGFEKQWKALNQASPIPPKSDFLTALQTENLNKNRYSRALPVDHSRVLLLPVEDDEATTYINAAYVDSFKQKKAFILTQSPLPRTTSDFWRMICEHGVSSIVMLNAVDEGDDYAKFWPESGTCQFDTTSVECLPSNKKDEFLSNSSLKPMYRTVPTELVVRNFQVTDTRNQGKTYKVKVYQYAGWTESRVPNTYKAVINLLTQIERWQQQSGNGPICVMCSDGIGRSGTLAAIMYVLERVKIDHVFDVFQAIKQMRIQRPHLVKYMDQYKYIHFAVQEYLTAFVGLEETKF